MLYCFFNKFFESLKVFRVSEFCKATTCIFCKFQRIKWSNCISIWSSFCLCSKRSCRTCLPCCECIVFIIKDDIDHIDISTTGMDKVPHPNTISISISSHNYNRKIRICKFHSSCKWNRTSMKRLSSVSIHILACFSRTSNSRNNYSIMRSNFKFSKRIFESHDDEEISTSWTPLYICQSASHSLFF